MKNRTVCHRMKQPMRSHTSHKPNGRHTGFLLMKPAMAFQPDLPFLLTSLCLSPGQTSGGIFFQGFIRPEVAHLSTELQIISLPALVSVVQPSKRQFFVEEPQTVDQEPPTS